MVCGGLEVNVFSVDVIEFNNSCNGGGRLSFVWAEKDCGCKSGTRSDEGEREAMGRGGV